MFDDLQRLHPAGESPKLLDENDAPFSHADHSRLLRCDTTALVKILRQAQGGAAPGGSGWTEELLSDARAGSDTVARYVAAMLTDLANDLVYVAVARQRRSHRPERSAAGANFVPVVTSLLLERLTEQLLHLLQRAAGRRSFPRLASTAPTSKGSVATTAAVDELQDVEVVGYTGLVERDRPVPYASRYSEPASRKVSSTAGRAAG